ncbi:hypothetical protein ACFYPG_19015 [Micromonospora sp. NPDC005553]|uniref:hypothetical protein n=1 Tax=Micromonospora sp. NPDC005553 TaxID=3364232 RepID=UPI003693F2FD
MRVFLLGFLAAAALLTAVSFGAPAKFFGWVVVPVVITIVLASMIAIPCAVAASKFVNSVGDGGRTIDGQLEFLKAFLRDLLRLK